MNLTDKNINELAQMISDKEQDIILAMNNLSIVEAEYHEIAKKILLLENEKLNMAWPIKIARRNIQTKKLELKQIETAFFTAKRNQ